MSRDHALRPNGYSKKLQGFVRMKQHPDRQPRRAKPVDGGDDDNRDADYEFEGKRIDDCDLWGRKLVRGTVRC
jgi:hypothetical protein